MDAVARLVAPDALPARERLLLIDIIDAEGLVIVQTIWAVTADRHGRRRTGNQSFIKAKRAAPKARVNELLALIHWEPADRKLTAVRQTNGRRRGMA